MIIYEFEGDQYALCSRRCALLFRWCPSLRAEPPLPDVSFGCVWCGEDVTAGLDIDWLP